MYQMLLIKSLLGAGMLGGIATAGSYFGTKITMEQHFSNLTKNTEKQDWQKSWDNLSTQDSTDLTPKSILFQKIKNTNKENLENKCKDLYKNTYKVFGTIYSEKLITADIKNYCYKTSPSS